MSGSNCESPVYCLFNASFRAEPFAHAGIYRTEEKMRQGGEGNGEGYCVSAPKTERMKHGAFRHDNILLCVRGACGKGLFSRPLTNGVRGALVH